MGTRHDRIIGTARVLVKYFATNGRCRANNETLLRAREDPYLSPSLPPRRPLQRTAAHHVPTSNTTTMHRARNQDARTAPYARESSTMPTLNTMCVPIPMGLEPMPPCPHPCIWLRYAT
jgi:hypothetical protein